MPLAARIVRCRPALQFLRRADAKTLDANADWLKANPNQLVRIDGNCEAAMTYPVSNCIAAERITVVSYGKERPVCTEHNESCCVRTRRDDFLTKPT